MKLHGILIASASVSALVMAAPAVAQETSSEAADKITVTGSRIARKDYGSSSPVVTVDAEQIDSFGNITVEEALNILPQFIEGSNAGTIAIGGGGGATLNMRALGSNRNLVLLDQRRLPVATPFGDVDVNIVPTVILENVEVLTGGASSVYGSEAISGVVNFQSARYFEGVKANIDYGDAFQGGAERFDSSVLLSGTGLDGRGRGMIALGYTDRSPLRGRDREFFDFAVQSSFIEQGTFRSGGNAPDPTAVEALFASYGITGVTATDNLGFNDDGTLFARIGAQNYNGPSDLDSLNAIVNGSVVSPVGRQGTALKGLERFTALAKGEYDLTDSITTYAQFLVSDAQTSGSASLNITLFGPTALVPVTNPFIPGDLAGLLATRSDPSADFILNQRFSGIPERTHEENFTTTQFVVGIKGDVGIKDWTFDVYGLHDDVSGRERIRDLLLGSRLNDLLQAPDGGDSICEGGYNPFGAANATSISAECLAFLAPDVTSTLDLTRNTAEGFVTGSLFALPAGEVRFSVSASYREDKLDFNPALSVQTNDALGVGQSFPSVGRTTTTEFGGELLVPLLADAALAQSLNLTGGFRYADHNAAGGSVSWSGGVEWRPTQSLFVRGSVQRAVRNPNIGELFSAAIGNEITVGTPTTDPTLGDPCDIRTIERMGPNNAQIEAICIAQGLPASIIDSFQHTTTSLPTATGGNANLDPEKATTYTVGVVWRPELEGQDLSITVDYWNIEIDDVINTINGNNVLDRCFNAVFNPSFDPANEFCQLIERESATGTVERISTTFLNLASLKTSGVDLQVDHSIDVGPGTLRTRAAVGWVNNYEESALPGEPFLDYVGTIGGPANRAADNDVHPRWTANLTPTYSVGPASLSFRWRYLSSMDAEVRVTNPAATTPGVPAVSYFDLYGTYEVSEHFRLKAGISNLMDKDPPQVAGQTGQTRIGTYDVIGRAFNVGLSASF
jgi:outer membrane receptor protein involved in Fe transport